MNLATKLLQSISESDPSKLSVSLSRVSNAVYSLTGSELQMLASTLQEVRGGVSVDGIKKQLLDEYEILEAAASKQVVKAMPKASNLLRAIELLNIEELKSLTYALNVIGLERLPRYTAERLVQRIKLVLRQSRPRVLQ